MNLSLRRILLIVRVDWFIIFRYRIFCPRKLGISSNSRTSPPRIIRFPSFPPNSASSRPCATVLLSNNIVSEFPDALCRLPNLDVVDLSKNRISKVPPEVASLTAHELNLNQNQVCSQREKIPIAPLWNSVLSCVFPWLFSISNSNINLPFSIADIGFIGRDLSLSATKGAPTGRELYSRSTESVPGYFASLKSPFWRWKETFFKWKTFSTLDGYEQVRHKHSRRFEPKKSLSSPHSGVAKWTRKSILNSFQLEINPGDFLVEFYVKENHKKWRCQRSAFIQ